MVIKKKSDVHTTTPHFRKIAFKNIYKRRKLPLSHQKIIKLKFLWKFCFFAITRYVIVFSRFFCIDSLILGWISLTLEATSVYLRKSSNSSSISSYHPSNPMCYVVMLRNAGYRFRGWNTVAKSARVGKGLIAAAHRFHLPRRMRWFCVRDSGRRSSQPVSQQSVHCLLTQCEHCVA